MNTFISIMTETGIVPCAILILTAVVIYLMIEGDD